MTTKDKKISECWAKIALRELEKSMIKNSIQPKRASIKLRRLINEPRPKIFDN